jgi:sporulation protein YlmC with PRC-barrel domain
MDMKDTRNFEGHPLALSSSSLNGTKVVNSEGSELGTLEEVMVDIKSGHVAYVVLSFGGLLGIGDKLFAVPWDKITIDTDNHNVVIDVSKEQLEKAPGFDKETWPQTPTEKWYHEVYEFYESQPYWVE